MLSEQLFETATSWRRFRAKGGKRDARRCQPVFPPGRHRPQCTALDHESVLNRLHALLRLLG